MHTCARLCGLVFGAIMIALSLAITAEVLLRKFAAHSLGGVDELAGYAVAVGAPLAFTVALIERSHIRINLLHARMSPRAQAVLNGTASLSLAALALALLAFAGATLLDTWRYGSIAQTPWATPLIYPQTAWLLATAVFAAAACVYAARALGLMLRRDWRTLNRRYGPETIEEELAAELDDLAQREGAVK
ncbi:TRAP transporter small permease subunit [Verticiella sediminum]|uniref:TRAP transporter small permease protein n=1 Tax=Verticiella sediminum TaxID=1247510 RepID=A0A556ANI4_9BURK|nr:TRAP transporter small permease subunit [Verticiella sediminum]TSH94446.1 TRAP transporter small permease subunit [Verticiella sediminum]